LAKGREYNADLAGVGVADLLPLPQLTKPFNIGFEFIFSDRRTALFRPIVLVEICLVSFCAGQLNCLLHHSGGIDLCVPGNEVTIVSKVLRIASTFESSSSKRVF
jgi:hypothetical protein